MARRFLRYLRFTMEGCPDNGTSAPSEGTPVPPSVRQPDFRRLFEAAPGLYLVLNCDLVIVAVSDAYARATMTRRESILGRGIFDVFPDNPDDPTATGVKNLRESLQRVRTLGVSDAMPVQKYDVRRPEADGGGFEERYWSPFNSPVFGADGSLSWIIHRVEDITDLIRVRAAGLDQARVNEALRDSHRAAVEMMQAAVAARKDAESSGRDLRLREAELATLLDAIPAAVYLSHDAEGRHITGNQAADELLRNPRGAEASLGAAENVRPRHFRAFKDGRELATADLPVQRAARGLPVSHFEFTLVFDDGTVREVEAFASTLYDDEGNPRGSVGVLVDVTERKRARDALVAREAQLYSFVRQAPAAIAMFDRSMTCLAASERWTSDYGRGNKDLVGLNHYAVNVDLPERWKDVHRRALAGETLASDEDRWIMADGSERWLRWCVSPWLDAQGAIGGIMMLSEDISARRIAEEKLRESEERFRRVIEASQMGTFEIDLADMAVHCNATLFGLFGLAPDSEAVTASGFFPYVHPDDLARFTADWEEARRTGQLDVEFRVVRPDGTERWLAGKGGYAFHGSSSAEPGGGSSPPARFFGVVFDITERKRAETSFAEASQRLAGIVGSAMDAIISVNDEQRVVLFNAAAETMFRCPASGALGAPLDRFIPERQRSAHAPQVRAFGATGATSRTMGRLGTVSALRADGEEFPIEASISHHRIDGGNLYTVIVRDITERLRAERERAELQQATVQTLALLDALQYNAPVGIAFVDREYRYLRVNQVLAALNAHPVPAHLGRTVAEIVPHLWPMIEPPLRQAVEQGISVIESELQTESRVEPGLWQHWLVSYFPVRQADAIVGAGVIVFDITERKRLEEEVIEISTREQRRIGQDLHDDLCQWLIGTELLGSSLVASLATQAPASAELARRIVENLRQVSSRARALARGLAPAVIASEGLGAALRELAASAETMFRIQCTYLGPERVQVRDEVTALHLYRIAQEAISNAVRHGQAHDVLIQLDADNQRLTLCVRDDGVGFPHPLPPGVGMGLRTMRYRAGAIGGTLEIRPRVGRGTEVICTMPHRLANRVRAEEGG